MAASTPHWALWAILGAVLGFAAGRGTARVDDGPGKDDRILRVVVLGWTVHYEEGTRDSIYKRSDHWQYTVVATLTVLGAAGVVALRALAHRVAMTFAPAGSSADEPATNAEGTPESWLGQLGMLLRVTVIGAIIVMLVEAILGLLYPEFRPEWPYRLLPAAVPPLMVLALIAVGERQHPLARMMRFLVTSVIVLFMLAGASAVLAFAFMMMG